MSEQDMIKQFNKALDLLLEKEASELPESLANIEDCKTETEIAQMLIRLDPSKQSKIRQTLRQSLMNRIRNKDLKSVEQETELSDEDLDEISAAGDNCLNWDK